MGTGAYRPIAAGFRRACGWRNADFRGIVALLATRARRSREAIMVETSEVEASGWMLGEALSAKARLYFPRILLGAAAGVQTLVGTSNRRIQCGS